MERPEDASLGRRPPLACAIYGAKEAAGRCLLLHGALASVPSQWTYLLHAKPARLAFSPTQNYPDEGNYSHMPLAQAASLGRVEFVVILLSHGVPFDDADELGRTPLIWASMCGSAPCARLLLDAGAGINRQDSEGNTAISHAAGVDACELLALLIERGGDVMLINAKGDTALNQASRKGHLECSKMLVRAGAKHQAQEFDRFPGGDYPGGSSGQ